MKKAEKEAHQAAYHSLMDKARSAEREGLYRTAVELALESWDHIDGMMQYEHKYEEREFDGISAINTVLKYAPLLLDYRSLDKLEALLKNCRRIEKNTSESLGDRHAKAKEMMWDAHRMWGHLEQHPEGRQDKLRRILGGDQDRWRSIAEAWDKMGLLHRTSEGGSYRLSLFTRMGEVVSGKCPSCGSVVRAPKAMFLEEEDCPECRATVVFVILSFEISTDVKE